MGSRAGLRLTGSDRVDATAFRSCSRIARSRAVNVTFLAGPSSHARTSACRRRRTSRAGVWRGLDTAVFPYPVPAGAKTPLERLSSPGSSPVVRASTVRTTKLGQSTARMNKWEAGVCLRRRGLRQRSVTEKGSAFCDRPCEEAWVELVTALADIGRLEASPLGHEALGEARDVELESLPGRER